jgi:CHAP domain
VTQDERVAKVLAMARGQVGVAEKPRGSNAGPEVEGYLAVTGLDGGYPWCAAFVAWCGLKGLGKEWPIVRSADCDALLAQGRKLKIVHTSPQIGDIFLRLASPNDANHTGFVTTVDTDGVGGVDGFGTIEGNTNGGGSRDGYGVFARSRSMGPYTFLRWIDAVDTAPKWVVKLAGGVWPSEKVLERNGRPVVPVRAFAARVAGTGLENSPVVWAADAVSVAGTKMREPHLIDGTAWAPVREIAEALGSSVVVDGKTIQVGAPAPRRS